MIDFGKKPTVLGTIYCEDGTGKAIHSHNISDIFDLNKGKEIDPCDGCERDCHMCGVTLENDW